MALKLVTPPETEPVSLEQAKAQLRVTDSDQDSLIGGKVRAAREFVETQTQRALLEQTWRLSLDRFPWDGVILLPRPPLLEVVSVKYVDALGVLQTLTEDVNYTVDADSEPARLVPAYELAWPESRDVPNAVLVEFTAGYGSDPDAVPGELVEAMLLWIQHLYDGDDAAAQVAVRRLEPYRVWRIR